MALLTKRDDRGRSILGDLLGHVERNAAHCSVFASTLGAPDLDELRAHATDKPTLLARLSRSKELKSTFEDYLLPLCAGSVERTLAFLPRFRTYAIDEPQIRDRVEFAIRKLFYATGGAPLDAAGVRGHLGDLLQDCIHQPIREDTILRALEKHGVRRGDWALDKTVTDQIAAICDSYTEPLRSELVNKTFLPIPGSDDILGPDDKPVESKVLVVAEAGAGKSCTLCMVVERLRRARVPVLSIRLDLLPAGMLTTVELGRKLGLPESPLLVLAGVAKGGPSVLVVDQLDAVSIVSGRETNVWQLFDSLQREAARTTGLHLIVGCRGFDLDHDHRMRSLKATGSGFKQVQLKSLLPEHVDAALRQADIAPETVQPTLKSLLTVPLHLSMYLSLPAPVRLGVHSRNQLFDCFWDDKERRTEQRLGRKPAWTAVIDILVNWLSDNQQLSAPQIVLDDHSRDARAMASERVLVLADGRYRFFHESFFDYAFARRFGAKGARLIDLLMHGEQHLFRRAQVRQILAFTRGQNWDRYLVELKAVLTARGVRFHITRFVLQWMSSLPDPRQEEWEVLQSLLRAQPGLWSHVRGIVMDNEAWFDVLDASNFFQDALTSGDMAREQEAVRLLGWHDLLRARPSRIAALLRQYRRPTDEWNQYLRYVCRHGDAFHSREVFDLFLSLIEDGTLDDARPGIASNDSWWSMLYSLANDRPDLASEAIARWLDRALATWKLARDKMTVADEEAQPESRLWNHLDHGGNGTHVILDAAKDHRSFAQHMLPRVARVVDDTAKDYSKNDLQIDPLWSHRTFGDDPIQTDEAILCGLAKSLEALARTEPAELDRLLTPYKDRPQNTIAYLVLRAWTAAPDTYADQLADYLAADPRRLKVGYSSSGIDGGSAANYVSSQAVKTASARCTVGRFVALERAIIDLRDDWEAKHPQTRGRIQLELLEAMDASRLSAAGLAKLRELKAKFPSFDRTAPQVGRASFVGSPVPQDAHERMSDDQWIGAMRKYAGVEHRRGRPIKSSGGEYQLAQALEVRAKADPVRFAALANRMGDDLPASYFDAILRGAADCTPQPDNATHPLIAVEQVAELVRRVHRLPNRPCGQWIAYVLQKRHNYDWPDDIIDTVAWYACNDPDPDKELWKTATASGQCYYGGKPHDAGINSTRGSIAGALAQLLFDKPERFERVRDAVHSVSHDRSIAVRACAIRPLLAVLNIDASTATAWFGDCVTVDQVLFEVHDVERFVQFAAYRDYAAIRPVVIAMLASQSEKAVKAAARQVCLSALNGGGAKDDANDVRTGTAQMRKAAAEVYSANIAHEVVGAECRRLLKPFLADPDEGVRAEAASAFHHVSGLSTETQADLLAGFLEASPGPKALEQVVRALEDSPVRMPDLVCRLAEQCVGALRDETGSITNADSMAARNLSKIVIRLYAQTDDMAIRGRCLTLIDEMLLCHFFGLTEELRKLDR